MKNSVIRKIRSNSIIQHEPAMQFCLKVVRNMRAQHSLGLSTPRGPALRSCWAPAEAHSTGGMPCQAPTWLCQGISWILKPLVIPHLNCHTDVQFCDVPNTATKRRPTWCWYALSTNSKINWVGTNLVSPGLFLLPLMLLALIQLLLINFHQV